MVTRPFIAVVDDDQSIRDSLPELLREFGFDVRAYASAEEFLSCDALGRTRCLVLDIAMPGMSGPALQRELAQRGRTIPIVFITANTDEEVRETLIAAGAVECLAKPFSDTQLFDAVKGSSAPESS
jgi:FixJ family two-component response regulator